MNIFEELFKKNGGNPCMKCGSVQCAFCYEDIKKAIYSIRKELLKKIHKRIERIPVIMEKDNYGLIQYAEVAVIIDKTIKELLGEEE
mgnify:CR=1 FL=1